MKYLDHAAKYSFDGKGRAYHAKNHIFALRRLRIAHPPLKGGVVEKNLTPLEFQLWFYQQKPNNCSVNSVYNWLKTKNPIIRRFSRISKQPRFSTWIINFHVVHLCDLKSKISTISRISKKTQYLTFQRLGIYWEEALNTELADPLTSAALTGETQNMNDARALLAKPANIPWPRIPRILKMRHRVVNARQFRWSTWTMLQNTRLMVRKGHNRRKITFLPCVDWRLPSLSPEGRGRRKI